MGRIVPGSLRSGRIQPKRADAATWTALNPVLEEGELAYEIGTGKFKIGDGSTAWSGLEYAGVDDLILDAKADLVDGKLPISQLPVDVMEFKGVWDASTNTPTLADATGSQGDYYKVSVGGARDLGSGSQTFVAGDAVILNVSSVWERLKASTIASAVSVAAISGMSATDAQAALAELRGQVQSVGSSSATKADALAPTAVKTGAYTAAANEYVPVDTTAGVVAITLPTAPADKTRVGVKHVIQGGTNAVTIARGGSDVFNRAGGSTSLSLPLLDQGFTLQYKASAGIWYAQSEDTPLSGL